MSIAHLFDFNDRAFIGILRSSRIIPECPKQKPEYRKCNFISCGRCRFDAAMNCLYKDNSWRHI